MYNWQKVLPAYNRSYLALLPEEVYDKSPTSHIVRLMDALCGDASVGRYRRKLMLKRLQTTLAETRFGSLDTVYSQLFALPRLSSEQYSYSESDFLTWGQVEEMLAKDAAYRRRIWAYMLAFQYGATKRGIELCAEAGCGYPCQVIDYTEYDASIALNQGEVEKFTLDGSDLRTSNGSQYLIVVMRDTPITAEESHSIANALSRLMPQDSVWSIIERKTVLDRLGADYCPDTEVPIAHISSSSAWWNVVNYVTGRNDWDYEKYPTMWIEPNVRKEAPRQLMVWSQESALDYTYMTSNAGASSEHVGPYGAAHRAAFPSLGDIPDGVVMQASAAVSKRRSKSFSASFYDGPDAVDWSYPIALNAEQSFSASEGARYARLWSSEEREGNEWLELAISRRVPINSITFNICRKPVRIIPYLSSAENGERVWKRIRNADGVELFYDIQTWGGGSIAGELLAVTFSFPVAEADAIRLEFQRLDVPYLRELRAGGYEKVEFNYSIEVSDLAFGQNILYKDDFRPASFLDPYGNKVESELRVLSPEGINHGAYWMSQPNIGDDAVEYLILDMRNDNGEPQRLNYLDIDALYGGCQFNLYSSMDGENWTPYPGDRTLESTRYVLQERLVNFVKLEFTSLCCIPYEVVAPEINVPTRRFPWTVQQYLDSVTADTRELQWAQKLLTTPEESSGDWDEYSQVIDPSTVLKEGGIDGSMLFSSNSYRTTETAAVVSAYGVDKAEVEQPPSWTTPETVEVESARTSYRFPEIGPHKYDERTFERTHDIAYVVGIQNIKAGIASSVLSFDNLLPIYLRLDGDIHLSENDGWVSEQGERLSPETDQYVCSFSTVDIQTACDFKSVDVAVNQSPAAEHFDYPSDMVKEWHGVGCEVERSEFGTNGTTMKCLPQGVNTGIESDGKLVHANSMASVQVGMFASEAGTWQLECLDSFGEQVFSMKYDVAARKWTNIGTIFTPQPGGGWWNRDYSYRVRLPLDGPLVRGQAIFVPNYDLDAMIQAAIETVTDIFSVKDLRVIHYNGVENFELPYDVTGDEELWFRLQQDVPSGYSADGAYHREFDGYLDAYYLYFGDKAEVDAPDRDYTKVFDGHEYTTTTKDLAPDGFVFDNQDECLDIKDEYRLPIAATEAGWFELMVTPTEALKAVPDGTVGIPEVRFLMDYDDGVQQAQCYIYEKQLTFVIREADGYENGYVSKFDPNKDIFSEGKRSKICVSWGARGSETNYENGQAVPGDKRRRKIEVYIDSDTPWPCIENIKDVTTFYQGVF